MNLNERRRTRQVPRREPNRASGLELRQLRAFVTLVDQGSQTGAAQVLGVAQSTVSEGLAALERALGTRVVVRRRGAPGIDLTPTGGALLPYARRVLASLDDARVAVAAVTRDVAATIEVMANESVSTYLLPRALGTVRQRWPSIRFAVTVGMCSIVTEELASGRFDLGLMLQTRTGVSVDAGGQTERAGGDLPLADVPLAVFCRPEHPLASPATGVPVPRAWLAPYTVFVSDARVHPFELCPGRTVRAYFGTDRLPGPHLEPAGSVEAVKRSVVTDSLALGVLPAYALAEELRARVVRPLVLEPDIPPLCLVAMPHHGRSSIHPAVAELIEVLRTTLGHRPELSSAPRTDQKAP
jgi:DNA-binding transcriptional LysR family regulator